jgi:hypothetical protein
MDFIEMPPKCINALVASPVLGRMRHHARLAKGQRAGTVLTDGFAITKTKGLSCLNILEPWELPD